VQSRGSLLKMGYPYNYEPLNFVRAAGALQRRLLHCGALHMHRAASCRIALCCACVTSDLARACTGRRPRVFLLLCRYGVLSDWLSD